MVGSRGEEPASLRVLEAFDDRARQRRGLAIEAGLERRLIQRDQCLEQEAMVLEIGVEASLTVLPRTQQAPVRGSHVVKDEGRALNGGLHVVVSLEHGARLRQGGDHERVPGRQALVVEPGADAVGARLVQLAADLRQPLRLRSSSLEDVGAGLERRRSEVRDRLVVLIAKDLLELVQRPHVELALDAL